MAVMVDEVATTANRLATEIGQSDWRSTSRTLDELAGLAVEALIQADDHGLAGINDAAAAAYAELVANHGVSATAGPQGVADQLVGLSRVFAAALRKRRSLTAGEEDLIVEDLTIRILRFLRSSNLPVSNIDLAARLGCRQETIARRVPRLRQAGYVRSWPAGRVMFNSITDAGRQLLSGRDGPDTTKAGQSTVTKRLIDLHRALPAETRPGPDGDIPQSPVNIRPAFPASGSDGINTAPQARAVPYVNANPALTSRLVAAAAKQPAILFSNDTPGTHHQSTFSKVS